MLKKSKKTILSVCCILTLLITAMPLSHSENIFASEEDGDVSLPTPEYVYRFDSTIGDAVVVNRENENEEGKTPTGEIPQPDSSASAKYEDGRNGKALYLDGTYGLKLPVSNLGKSYTISFWVKIDEEMADCAPILFAGRDYLGEDDLHWLSITKADWFYYEYPIGGSPVVWSRILTPEEAGWPWFGGSYNRNYEIMPETDWKYITLTVDGNSIGEYGDNDGYYAGHHAYIYIDGEFYEDGCIAKDVYDGIADTFVGINAWDEKFKGYIDDLAFYSEYMTAKQARRLYQDASRTDEEPTPGASTDPTPTEIVSSTPIPTVTVTPDPVPTATATLAPDKEDPDDYDDFDDFWDDGEKDEQSLILKKGETCQVTGGEYMALCDSVDMAIPGAKGPAVCDVLGLSAKWNMGRINETCGGSYDYAMVKKKKAVTYYITCTKSKMAVYVMGKTARIKKIKTKCLNKYTLKPGKKMRISAKTSKGVMFFTSGKGAKIKVMSEKKSGIVKNNRVIIKKGKKAQLTLKNTSKKKMVILVPNYTYKAKVTGSKK